MPALPSEKCRRNRLRLVKTASPEPRNNRISQRQRAADEGRGDQIVHQLDAEPHPERRGGKQLGVAAAHAADREQAEGDEKHQAESGEVPAKRRPSPCRSAARSTAKVATSRTETRLAIVIDSSVGDRREHHAERKDDEDERFKHHRSTAATLKKPTPGGLTFGEARRCTFPQNAKKAAPCGAASFGCETVSLSSREQRSCGSRCR